MYVCRKVLIKADSTELEMERGQVPDNSDAFLNKDVDQQAATVGMLEHLSAPVVEAMQSPVAADDSNITNNTDVELQLGALLDNILVSSTSVPTPQTVVSEPSNFLQLQNSIEGHNPDQQRMHSIVHLANNESRPASPERVREPSEGPGIIEQSAEGGLHITTAEQSTEGGLHITTAEQSTEGGPAYKYCCKYKFIYY